MTTSSFKWGGWGPIGRVDHELRMTRTELTTNQWLEFVDAYTRVNPAAAFDVALYGSHIFRTSNDPAHFGWTISADAQQAPADMGWYYAARYCNWLCNGKANTLAAFENGAYDASTFPTDGTFGGQLLHTTGAQFWIPTLDEWTKAMHWDPNKYGPGIGGYWLYPHSKDVPPIGGLPGTPGAETGAGTYDGGGFRIYPVGSYPNAQSPWGLLDGSGGVREWLENARDYDVRATRGSWNPESTSWDRLDLINGTHFDIAFAGLRIASAVPA